MEQCDSCTIHQKKRGKTKHVCVKCGMTCTIKENIHLPNKVQHLAGTFVRVMEIIIDDAGKVIKFVVCLLGDILNHGEGSHTERYEVPVNAFQLS